MIEVFFSDSDWAVCTVTRKSTSGGIVTIGKDIIKSWVTTQPFITRSSCEAELAVATKAGAEGLGAKGLCCDFNFGLKQQRQRNLSLPCDHVYVQEPSGFELVIWIDAKSTLSVDMGSLMFSVCRVVIPFS